MRSRKKLNLGEPISNTFHSKIAPLSADALSPSEVNARTSALSALMNHSRYAVVGDKVDACSSGHSPGECLPTTDRQPLSTPAYIY